MTDETNPKPDADEKPEAADGGDPSAADPRKADAKETAEESPAAAKAEAAEPAAAKASAKADPPHQEKPAEEAKASEAPAESAPAKQPDPVEMLKAEIADLKDRLLRAAAEMENQRRRQEREMTDARLYAVTGFARELLEVGDNLNRALAAVSDDMKKDEGAVAGLLRGVEATDRLLNRVLDKHGVRKFTPIGQKFDPHRHQAIFEVEDGANAPGTVVEVVQPGYSIGERVLRPALVAVSAPPKSRPDVPATAASKEAEADTADRPIPPGGG